MELKDIVAHNITELRKMNKWTQAELAEKLNYTDKAISKWERGESIPEVGTLKQIAEIFGCTVDVLLNENAPSQIKQYSLPRNVLINRRIITAAVSLVIWIIAAIAFVYSFTYFDTVTWQIFVWAVPFNCIVVYFFARKWKIIGKKTVFVSSLFLWSFLIAIYISTIQYQTWMIIIIGIPVQALIILLHLLK